MNHIDGCKTVKNEKGIVVRLDTRCPKCLADRAKGKGQNTTTDPALNQPNYAYNNEEN